MRKLWNKIVGVICKVSYDKLLHFCAGLILAAFFFIVLGMRFCVCPVICFAFVKELFDMWDDSGFDLRAFFAAIAGGAVIQLFLLV
jgi:hypothetical protein